MSNEMRDNTRPNDELLSVKLSKMFDMSKPSVLGILHKHGVKMRPSGRVRQGDF
jgi:hypothetical protein